MATKYFETQGPVDATVNYVVPRTAELAALMRPQNHKDYAANIKEVK